jgi:hypothetical protein
MAYDNAGMDWSIATVLGDDAALMAELRDALVSDALVTADLLRRSRCDANWIGAAQRLKGLAASFGAGALMAAADDALYLAPGDPSALRAVDAAIARLSGPAD